MNTLPIQPLHLQHHVDVLFTPEPSRFAWAQDWQRDAGATILMCQEALAREETTVDLGLGPMCAVDVLKTAYEQQYCARLAMDAARRGG